MIIRPLGEHRERLIQNLGRDQWVYDGEPERQWIALPGIEIEVWLFQWERIPADVQAVMVRNHAAKIGKSEDETLRYLQRIPHAIPCEHIAVVDER